MLLKSKFIVSFAGLLTALSLPFGSVSAAVLEEIIVTSERREASLQDVPIAVSTLDVEQLGNLQITEARDLQRYVPSLNMFNNITSPTNLSLSLRGGLQQDASIVTAESPIGIYVDDIYVGRLNGNDVTLSDIERVEVLRGPQGTLYGRNTGYGAIRFMSRTPGEDMWFDASAGIGNDDQVLFSASVGGPLGAGWAGSFSGRWKEKDGQYFNVAENTDTGLEENLSVRGKLRYMGLDDFDAVLTVSFSDSENDSLQMPNAKTPSVQSDCRPGTPGFVQPCTGGVTAQFTSDDLVLTNGEFATNTAWGQISSQPPFGERPRGDTEKTIVGLNLSWDISDRLTVRSITGYVGLDDYFHTDFNGNSGDPAEFFAVLGSTDVESDQWTQEIQFLGSIGDKLTYLAGAFYLHEESEQPFAWNLANQFFVVPPGGPQVYQPISVTRIDTEIDSIAVFADASYQFTDNLRGTVGIRWTDDSKDFTFDYESFFFPPFGPQKIILTNDTDEWTPRALLEYTFADSDIMLYGSVARGFKGGGFSAIAIFSSDPAGTYEPETNWTYEGGLKAEWFDNRLRTNLAYFFSDIEDVQQNSTDSTSAALEFPVQNSGDAEIQGLEFEITAVPIDGLNLFLSGALLDGEYTRLEPESSAAAARVIYGVEPETPQTPDYAFNIGFDYTVDLPGDVFGDLSFGLDYYEIDEYITAATNDFRNKGWDQINGFISLGLADNWELKFTGKNIGDETNVTSGSRGLGGFIYLPPVEYLFSVTYRMN